MGLRYDLVEVKNQIERKKAERAALVARRNELKTPSLKGTS